MKLIILASKSPRRKQLFSLLGLPFKIVDSKYQENFKLKMKPENLAKFFAQSKAKAVATHYRNAIIIGADTIIVHQNKIYGKPYTKQKATLMLKELSNTTHWAITGLAVLDSRTGKMISKVVKTKVTFRKIHLDEIISYVRTGEPLHMAGAYGLWGKAATFAKKVEGEYCNVVGLPLCELSVILRKFGIKL
ncbi:MAG: Maf family protein [Candidatus Doudnabacteria bacterium]|nr:Maf family protein [Candidatus Doudnabacteria bacterium]